MSLWITLSRPDAIVFDKIQEESKDAVSTTESENMNFKLARFSINSASTITIGIIISIS